MNEDASWWAVFCSDDELDGRRVKLSRPPGVVRLVLGDVDYGMAEFQWDGTYDEHGDARYRLVGAQHSAL